MKRALLPRAIWRLVVLPLASVFLGAILCFAASSGAWLRKVPPSDRGRVNPYAGSPEAIAAGQVLYREHCAKCHGEDAEGHGSRPALRSERLAAATDGEIAWILKNGQVFKGMPSWAALPEQQRWQIVAYLRSLNPPVAGR